MKNFEEEVVKHLKLAMGDIRSAGAIRQLKEWVTRIDNDKNRTSRAYQDTPDNAIADMTAFIDAINVDNCSFEKVNVRKDRYNNTLAGIKVTPRDLFIRTYPRDPLDEKITMDRATNLHQVSFILEDRNDNDKEIKIKVAYVMLVHPDTKIHTGAWE